MFRFKQFTIRQDRCPMKVGTDGVLLGAWAEVRPGDRRILDIGTGTGLIALMMAQRAPAARITGIDVEDISEARANADASPWGGRVEVLQCPVQEFGGDGFCPPPTPLGGRARLPGEAENQFDLIVSNPPFFVDSLTCPDAGRTTARHAVRLPFDELRDAARRLLAPDGRFAVILPADEAQRFIAVCEGVLTLARRTDVRTTPHAATKRVLMEFVHAATASTTCTLSATSTAGAGAGTRAPEPATLTIGTGEHECYTPEYRALTRDFYLKF